MLYATLNQPYLLLIFLLIGFASGLVFDIGNFIKFLCANKKIPSIILDVFETSICLVILFFSNLKYNLGQIRLFPLLVFFIFFSLERLTLGKMVAKIYLSCYNLFDKFKKRMFKKNTNETNKNG